MFYFLIKSKHLLPCGFSSLCHVLSFSKYMCVDLCLSRNSRGPQISRKSAHTHTLPDLFIQFGETEVTAQSRSKCFISQCSVSWPTPQYANESEPRETILSMLGLPHYATILLYLEVTSLLRKTCTNIS